ncbi:DUF2167 domain-containing protein [Chondromyces crocatus]|nr:DUF2167 domain-containing protein [Chondromyces crocatus]
MLRPRQWSRLALGFATVLPAATLTGAPARADIAPPPVEIAVPSPRPPPPAPLPRPTPPAPAPSSAPAAQGAATADLGAGVVPSPVEGQFIEGADQLPEHVRQILSLPWKPGPTQGALGVVAQLDVPEGTVFADAKTTQRFLELNQNPTSKRELGMISAADFSWSIIFQFAEIGYVKDEDKADLDAGAMMQALRQGNDRSNEVRRERGWGTVSLVGWAQPPRYEPTTHNLEWATTGQDDTTGGQTVNHNIRILGRNGVMEASLIVAPEDYAAALPTARKLLERFSYNDGERYAEYKPGDKIAEIGLVGLVTGGAVAAAAKTGILGKLGKGAVKLVMLLVAGVGALGAKLFRRNKEG